MTETWLLFQTLLLYEFEAATAMLHVQLYIDEFLSGNGSFSNLSDQDPICGMLLQTIQHSVVLSETQFLLFSGSSDLAFRVSAAAERLPHPLAGSVVLF